MTIESAVDIDDFQDAEPGKFETLLRNFYSASVQVSVPGYERTAAEVMENSGSTQYLAISSYKNLHVNFSTVFNVEFYKL